MINLFNPALWLALILGFAMAFGAGDLHGHRAEAKTAALVTAKADAAVSQAKSEATAAVATSERAMSKRLDVIEQTHQQEKDNAEAKIASLHADIRNGAVRLSIATSAARQNADTGSAAAAADNQETRAELLPETADALVSLAADADRSVLDLNACIDVYNSARGEVKKVADALK